MLGLRREFADRHVFDHAPAQRAHGLVGHGDAPVLSERLLAPHLQDRTPRPASILTTPLAAVPYRASGLVHWPIATLHQEFMSVMSESRQTRTNVNDRAPRRRESPVEEESIQRVVD